MILSLIILLNNPSLIVSLINELKLALESSPELTDTFVKISGLPPKLNKRLEYLHKYLFEKTIYANKK